MIREFPPLELSLAIEQVDFPVFFFVGVVGLDERVNGLFAVFGDVQTDRTFSFIVFFLSRTRTLFRGHHADELLRVVVVVVVVVVCVCVCVCAHAHDGRETGRCRTRTRTQSRAPTQR